MGFLNNHLTLRGVVCIGDFLTINLLELVLDKKEEGRND